MLFALGVVGLGADAFHAFAADPAAPASAEPSAADLTRGDHDDAYRESIIRRGGEALGRSSAMPAWSVALGPDQLRDLLQFVRTLRPVPPPARDAASEPASP